MTIENTNKIAYETPLSSVILMSPRQILCESFAGATLDSWNEEEIE